MDPASSVRVNPLAQILPGFQSGFGMGIQSHQLGLQANQQELAQKQFALQQQQAQMQYKVQQAQIMKEALSTAHENFDSIAKINPDAAIDYYHNKISPLQDQFWGQYGINMDSSQIPASHANADIISQINKATDLALTGADKIPIAQNILSHLQSRMDVGEMAQKRISEATKAVGSMQDYNKHLDDLEKSWDEQVNLTEGEPSHPLETAYESIF
jgi:hypothetical protein